MMLAIAAPAAWSEGSKVEFDKNGIAQVDGKPFFPVGLFTYELNSHVMADMHELQFNTIVGIYNHDQLDYINEHGLMAICHSHDEWFDAAVNHPSLLAWYLTDEPESQGKTPEIEKQRYLELKAKDPNHPIGLCHFLYDAFDKYKEACDLNMSDVYPILADRDGRLLSIGDHIDQARRVHNPNWPVWTYIQIFGGPETDGGKWAQPLPHEVRCMTFLALVHRTQGILYFSYWPKAPRTWESVGELNKEIHRLVPWLVADGTELEASSTKGEIQVRARKVGKGGVVIMANTTPRFIQTEVSVKGVRSARMNTVFGEREVLIHRGKFVDTLAPFEGKAYVWGKEPSP